MAKIKRMIIMVECDEDTPSEYVLDMLREGVHSEYNHINPSEVNLINELKQINITHLGDLRCGNTPNMFKRD